MNLSAAWSTLVAQFIGWLELHWPVGLAYNPYLAAGAVVVAALALGRILAAVGRWVFIAAVTAAGVLVAARILGV